MSDRDRDGFLHLNSERNNVHVTTFPAKKRVNRKFTRFSLRLPVARFHVHDRTGLSFFVFVFGIKRSRGDGNAVRRVLQCHDRQDRSRPLPLYVCLLCAPVVDSPFPQAQRLKSGRCMPKRVRKLPQAAGQKKGRSTCVRLTTAPAGAKSGRRRRATTVGDICPPVLSRTHTCPGQADRSLEACTAPMRTRRYMRFDHVGQRFLPTSG